MSEWKPIEEHPKTSERMLLALPVGETRRVVTGGWDTHWTGQCWVFDQGGLFGAEPTHFMPLPTPPKE